MVQHREGEVAPAPLRGGLVHLERVVELEQLERPRPVVDEPVEGREKRCASLEVVAERRGVDAPLALRPLDHRRLACLPHVDRLDRHRGGLAACDPEGGEPPFVHRPPRLVGRRDDDVRRVDALGDVPRRSRPTRPAIATSPLIIRNSSIWVTFRVFVQPVDAQGTTQVSGISRELGGRSAPSSARMSRRNRSFSRSQTRGRSMARPLDRSGEDKPQIGRRTHERVVLEERSVVLERTPEVRRDGTPRRAGSRRRGRRSERSPRSGRSEAGSVAARPRASRPAAGHRAVVPAPRHGGPAPS